MSVDCGQEFGFSFIEETGCQALTFVEIQRIHHSFSCVIPGRARKLLLLQPAAEAIVEEKDEAGNVKEFFNTQVYLTVSGQLHLEAAAG